MEVDSAAFKAFLSQHGLDHPHNEIRQTHQKFHCKWLLLSCSNHDGVVFQRGPHFPHLSCCLDKDTVQDVTMKQQGMPLPPDPSNVMDGMEVWGRNVSPLWHHQVMNYMMNLFETKRRNSQAVVFFDCVKFEVENVLADNFMGNDNGHVSVSEQWAVFFGDLYQCREKDFYFLAVRSLQFICSQIRMHHASSGVADNVQSNDGATN